VICQKDKKGSPQQRSVQLLSSASRSESWFGPSKINLVPRYAGGDECTPLPNADLLMGRHTLIYPDSRASPLTVLQADQT